MNRINLTDRYDESIKNLTVYEILNKLAKKFPEGFKSNEATTFLKREYPKLFFFPFSYLSQDLLYSDYISRGDKSHRPKSKYIYHINLNKLSIFETDKEKLNIEKIVDSYSEILTPKLGKGSLKEELLNDLRLVFKDL